MKPLGQSVLYPQWSGSTLLCDQTMVGTVVATAIAVLGLYEAGMKDFHPLLELVCLIHPWAWFS